MHARQTAPQQTPRRHGGFSLIEILTVVATLIILLGLMISLSRHVRTSSAEGITKNLLLRLDEAMAQYVHRKGTVPSVPELIPDPRVLPSELELQQAAVRNNEGFIRALKSEGLLNSTFNDLSISYFDEVRIRDAWGTPIVFMQKMHPAIGMNPKGWFFFSAGPDRQFLTRDDNEYSYEQVTAQPGNAIGQ